MKEELQDKALSYLENFEKLAIEYTPQAIDMGLLIARIEGGHKLIFGFLCLLFVFGYLFFARRVINDEVEPVQTQAELIELQDKMFVFLAFVSIPFTILGVGLFFNIWNWVAVFCPEVYAGYMLIN